MLSDTQPLSGKVAIELLKHPRRLELQKDVTLEYAHQNSEGVDIVIHADIEKLNSGETPANYPIGWCNGRLENLLKTDSDSTQLARYFYVDNSKLFTRISMRFFMVTTRADIAASDCLFYFVDELQ